MFNLPPFRRSVSRSVRKIRSFHSSSLGREPIALLLIYVLLVQCIPVFSRVADAVTLNGGRVLPGVSAVASVETTPIFGPTQFNRTTGAPNQYVEQFSLAGTISPYTLSIQNGALNGTNRVSSPFVTLNGVIDCHAERSQ